jgi:hypothetical protein
METPSSAKRTMLSGAARSWSVSRSSRAKAARATASIVSGSGAPFGQTSKAARRLASSEMSVSGRVRGHLELPAAEGPRALWEG